jgi:hypothetical protein
MVMMFMTAIKSDMEIICTYEIRNLKYFKVFMVLPVIALRNW